MAYTEAVITMDATVIADAVWQHVIESGYPAEDVLKLMAATLAGNATNLEGSDPSFSAIDGSKTRVSASYSGGTRIVTLDAT